MYIPTKLLENFPEIIMAENFKENNLNFNWDTIFDIITEIPTQKNKDKLFPYNCKIKELLELLLEFDMKFFDKYDLEKYSSKKENIYRNIVLGLYLNIFEVETPSKGNIPQVYKISDLGEYITKLDWKERYFIIICQLLKSETCRKTLFKYIENKMNNKTYKKDEMIKDIESILIQTNEIPDGTIEADSTFIKCAEAVFDWIEWIINLINK